MLTKITPDAYDVIISLAYATPDNVTGKVIYDRPDCYLHETAALHLQKAIAIAAPLGYQLKILDAFRPTEAQWTLWNACPDPDFVADPNKGSPHSRGVAIDLTLVDRQTGLELDMGTDFDDFTPISWHGVTTGLSIQAQQNRLILLGIMSAAGWDFYSKEWWHYQLFNSREYPLYSNTDLDVPMMKLVA